MAPLKSLERDYPLIDSTFQNFCASHGIFTVEDFLIHDLYLLAVLAEQHNNSEKLKQGITQVLSIIESRCQLWLNGLELLDDVEQNKHALSTGCERIDAFLQGGIREGYLTELVGPSSSSKTQVCLQTASNVARKYSGRVMYFDSGNSFSSKRIVEFVSQMSDPANNQANRTLQQVMKSIVCHSIFDIFTLLDLLHQLKNSLRSQMGCQVRMLIIDSISSLISPVLGGSGAHGHALMVTAGFLLKELAHENNLAVLVTNHMVAGEVGVSKPALGESWKNIPHVRLLLSRDHVTNISSMSILKHPCLATGKSAEFVIRGP
ncbi:DNA repair protein RAD51-like protein 4 [Forsythia ovata]|uniref:DNA repair protein RAD51-like protein 4 n=1 Tax=Forsythia ovata TaxID=205694 RepID=A0ABD1UY70_9LAMI